MSMKMKNLKRILLMLFLVTSLFSFARGNSRETVRFGSKTVGYISVPSDWYAFDDSNPATSSTAKQVSIDNTNIITLDIVNTRNVNPELAVKAIAEKYLNSGISEENIDLRDANVNGYVGKQIGIGFDDGTVLIMYFIKANGKLYYIAQEGNPEHQVELAKVISTWKPDR